MSILLVFYTSVMKAPDSWIFLEIFFFSLEWTCFKWLNGLFIFHKVFVTPKFHFTEGLLSFILNLNDHIYIYIYIYI